MEKKATWLEIFRILILCDFDLSYIETVELILQKINLLLDCFQFFSSVLGSSSNSKKCFDLFYSQGPLWKVLISMSFLYQKHQVSWSKITVHLAVHTLEQCKSIFQLLSWTIYNLVYPLLISAWKKVL